MDASNLRWHFSITVELLMGLSLGLIFVPPTTAAMACIGEENMANAPSLFNLVRNPGGSNGISAASTMQTRFQQKNLNQLGSHVMPYDASARNMMASMHKGGALARRYRYHQRTRLRISQASH